MTGNEKTSAAQPVQEILAVGRAASDVTGAVWGTGVVFIWTVLLTVSQAANLVVYSPSLIQPT